MKKYIISISLLVGTTILNNSLLAQNTTSEQRVKETNIKVKEINRHIDIEDNKETENSKPQNSREISQNITVTKNVELSIENSHRNIVIKTWNKPMINLVTTINYEGEDKLTESEWFERINLYSKTFISGDVSNVRIKSGKMNGNNINVSEYASSTGRAYFNGQGDNIGTEKNKKRIITITIPANTKLDIENKYANMNIEDNVTDIKINISNGSIEMQDAASFLLRSKYSNVTSGNIGTADVDIANGKLIAKKINTLDIDSKYTTLEIDEVNTANIKSMNDEYEIENVKTIIGRKNYGSIRLNTLGETIDIEGSNADVKIKNISNNIKLIRFDNKYADIRIPMKNVNNYTVDFDGNYSTVYSSFEKKKITKENKNASEPEPARASNTSSSSNCGCDSKFTAVVGNGGTAKVIMKCENCTVDFK
jgi:hypothetical protein